MKKTKLLSVFAVLLAMGITACNGGGDNKSSNDPSPQSGQQSEHKHEYGDWVQTKAPTCTEPGLEERVCECGDKETREVKALGHDFKNGTVVADTSTCTADGKQTIKCSRCDVTQDVDVKAHHRFGAETDVDGAQADGTMTYKKSVCSVDNLVQFRLPALDGTITGAVKDGTPEGYFKLTSNGQKVTFKIKVDVAAGKDGFIGTIYQRGALDNFNNGNSKRKYTDGGSGTRNGCNFEVKVNGVAVNMNAYKNIPIDEMSAGGEDLLGEAYSPVTNCPIGQIVLNNGINEIVYERLGSYNLAVSDFIIQGNDFEHQHSNATVWSSDDSQHWHACVAPGCPDADYKADAADHTYGDPYDRVEPTCSVEGSYKQKCSVCEHVKTVKIAQLAHDYKTVLEDHAAGEGYIAAQTLACTHNCGSATMYKWSALDYDTTKTTAASDKDPKSVASGKAVSFDTSAVQGMGDDHSKKGTHLVYNVKVQKDLANVGLAMFATEAPYRADMFDAMENENSKGYIQNEAGEWVRPDSRYGIKVDGKELMVAKNNGAIKGAGTAWYQFPGISLTLTAGIHEIEFFKYGGYDVDIYSYALTGLGAAEVHHLGDTWVSTDADVHYKTCTDVECPNASARWEVADHEWDEGVVISEASCTSIGSKKYTCKVCGKQKVDETPKLAHKYEAEEAEAYAAGEGYIAAKAYNCETCNHSVLRWSAMDYDTTSTKVENKTTYVRFNGVQYSGKNAEDKGSHLIYKIKSPVAATNVGLAFEAEANNGAPLFKTVSGDSSVGYELVDGEFVAQDNRYGLLVNGVKVAFGDSSSSNASGTKAWHQFPVTFDLQEGVNTIDLYQLGGYRAKMYNFQITEMPHVTPSHRHTLSTDLGSDAVHHWNTCTGEGCPLPAGSHINETEHVAGTTAVKNSKDQDVFPINCECGATGYQMKLKDCSVVGDGIDSGSKVKDGSVLTYTFKVAKAGKVSFQMHAKLGSGDNEFANGGDKGNYALKAGSSDGVITVAGHKLSEFGATAANPVYFEMGYVVIAESDIDENGEVSISITFPTKQDYRHVYSDFVRIIYVD